MEHTVGKDVATFEIGAELHFVDGKKRYADVCRHGLDGTNPIIWMGRHDAFLAGDECYLMIAGTQADTVVDFPGEQPQRQTDHAAPMRQHALDGVVSFSGIGGPQNGSDGARRRHHNLSATHMEAQAPTVKPLAVEHCFILNQRGKPWIQTGTFRARIADGSRFSFCSLGIQRFAHYRGLQNA